MKNSIWTYDEYTLPVWAICPIVNDDYSGIEDEDTKAIEEFLETLPENGSFEFPDNMDEEKYFHHDNDIDGQGGDVIDCKYHYQTTDIEIIVATGNQPSQLVAEKAGAHREGVLRNRLHMHEKYHDAVMYSLVPGDI